MGMSFGEAAKASAGIALVTALTVLGITCFSDYARNTYKGEGTGDTASNGKSEEAEGERVTVNPEEGAKADDKKAEDKKAEEKKAEEKKAEESKTRAQTGGKNQEGNKNGAAASGQADGQSEGQKTA